MTALLVIAHAVTFRASFPPFDAWFLMPVSIALLCAAAIGARRTLFLVGCVAIALFVMWMQAMFWVKDVTAVGYPFKCVGMMAFGLLFAVGVRTVSRTPGLARWPMMIVAPLLWTGVECFRGDVAFHGYPWYLAAHPFAAVPVWIQSADLMGSYFIGSLAACVAGAMVDFTIGGAARSLRRGCGIAVAVGVIVAANLVYGAWRLGERDVRSPGPRIAAIQTNLPQENKIGWTREQQDRDVPRFFDLARKAARDASSQLGGVDLIVWPETMLPGIGFDAEMMRAIAELNPDYDYMLRWQREAVALGNELGVPLLVGSTAWLEPTYTSQDGHTVMQPAKRYNSAWLIDGEPPYQRYDKYFLTPFGETMPYVSQWPWLEEKLLAVGAQGMKFDLDNGPNLAPLQLRLIDPASADAPATIGLATPICFEDSVSWVVRRMVNASESGKEATVIINMSNDGWFGMSDASRAHHLQIARFRCVENRVPMVRSVNTGFSASIDSCGRIAAVVGEGKNGTPRAEGVLVTQVQLDSRHTLYGRVGDVWAYLCLASTLGMLFATFALRRRSAS